MDYATVRSDVDARCAMGGSVQTLEYHGQEHGQLPQSSDDPGNITIRDDHGVQFVFCGARRVAGLHSLACAMGGLGDRHTTMVVGLPSHWTEAELQDAALTTTLFVDRYVLFDRSTAPDGVPVQVSLLFAEQLPERCSCELVPDIGHGLRRALHQVQQGERLIIVSDRVEQALEELERVGDAGGAPHTQG